MGDNVETTNPTINLPAGTSVSKSPKDSKEKEKTSKSYGNDIESGDEDARPSQQSDDWVPEDALEKDLEAEECFDTNGSGPLVEMDNDLDITNEDHDEYSVDPEGKELPDDEDSSEVKNGEAAEDTLDDSKEVLAAGEALIQEFWGIDTSYKTNLVKKGLFN